MERVFSTTLLILGDGSNGGRFDVQLLKLAGIEKIVVVGGSAEELHRYSATHGLDRHGGEEATLQHIREVVGDDLVHAFDTVNLPANQHLAISVISSSRKGRLARLCFPGEAIEDSKIIGEKRSQYQARNAHGLSHIKPEMAKPFWNRIENQLNDGSLVPLKAGQ